MPSRRHNAIPHIDDLLEPIAAALLPHGFVRTEQVFHRRSDDDLLPRLEAITVGTAYGFRTCWMHTTVKIPALVDLLAHLRGNRAREPSAWRVPDHAIHVACMLRLSELDGARQCPLPDGLHWRPDGRLQRARTVPASVLASTLIDLMERFALPALNHRLVLQGLARSAEAPGYAESGMAGRWALAARLALGDVDGAAAAFRAHPFSSGADREVFLRVKQSLVRSGMAVDDVPWDAARADAANPWQAQGWMTGALVR